MQVRSDITQYNKLKHLHLLHTQALSASLAKSHKEPMQTLSLGIGLYPPIWLK
jgi:hypothetical protein